MGPTPCSHSSVTDWGATGTLHGKRHPQHPQGSVCVHVSVVCIMSAPVLGLCVAIVHTEDARPLQGVHTHKKKDRQFQNTQYVQRTVRGKATKPPRGGGGVNVGRRSETAARHGKESFTCGQGLLPALVAGGGSISSRLITLVAPWRRLVAMQSVPVSPPPITITCAEARRRPRCRRGEQGSTQRRISAALCLPGFKRHTCDWPGSCILFLLHCCSTP